MAYTIFHEISLKNRASELEALAAKYDSAIADASRCLISLNGWESPAADAWRAELKATLSDALSTSAELRNIAGNIRVYVANHHYLLEEVVEAIVGEDS